ncbi:hypothetical protein LTR09_010136 [Extremus antarcticus]|uniref:F-box domain-containing protein n=1 Tax=Extremus antarcticus TaxID=702011 RepID=A0AAJ0D7Y0_9PEZI|nr:hypothetical protein LTR09_010136 [Extremus antarcticus]
MSIAGWTDWFYYNEAEQLQDYRSSRSKLFRNQVLATDENHGAPPMTASHRVFNIPELSEAIFLNLHTRDLLCGVQQTCRQWKTTVESSVSLREVLFFTPIPVQPLVWGKYDRCFNSDTEGWMSPAGKIQQTIYQHLLISRRNWLGSRTEGKTRAQESKDDRRRLNYPGATWRNCLIVQPPISELLYYTNGDVPHQVTRADGVTLGDVFVDADHLMSQRLSGIQGWNRWDNYKHAAQLWELKSGKGEVTEDRFDRCKLQMSMWEKVFDQIA